MASPFLTYHPAAKVVTQTPRAASPGRRRCGFHANGLFCSHACPSCKDRLDAKALDVITEQAATAVRTFGRNGQKGGTR